MKKYHVEKDFISVKIKPEVPKDVLYRVYDCNDEYCSKKHFDTYSEAEKTANFLTMVLKRGVSDINTNLIEELELNDNQIKERLELIEEIQNSDFIKSLTSYDIYCDEGIWSESRARLHKKVLHEFTSFYTTQRRVKMQRKLIVVGGLISDFNISTLKKSSNILLEDYFLLRSCDFNQSLLYKDKNLVIEGLTDAESSFFTEIESKYLMDVCLNNILVKGQNIIFEYDFESLKEGALLIEKFKSFGYDIELHFVNPSIDEAKEIAFKYYKEDINNYITMKDQSGGIPYTEEFFRKQVNFNGFESNKEEMFSVISKIAKLQKSSNFVYNSKYDNI